MVASFGSEISPPYNMELGDHRGPSSLEGLATALRMSEDLPSPMASPRAAPVGKALAGGHFGLSRAIFPSFGGTTCHES